MRSGKSTVLAWMIPLILVIVSAAGGGERHSFAVRSRCLMPLADDLPWECNDAVMIVRDGRIVAIGSNLKLPPDLPVLSFPQGVVVPGFVAAASGFGGAHRGDESIAAGYRAVDAFDRYGDYATTLAAGVTTVHMDPGSHRLLTGQGAVVKLGGAPGERIVREAADLSINFGPQVHNPPPDVTYSFPASADVAIPLPRPQRPASRMGQLLALAESIQQATAAGAELPFDLHRQALAEAWQHELPLRIRADNAADLRGAIKLLREWQRPGYVVGAADADRLADLIRAAEMPVVYQARESFRAPGGDLGLNPSARPVRAYDFAALHDVPFALAPPQVGLPADLRLTAVRASRAGLDRRRALEAITRRPAEILGVADRVGSLAPGRDADFLVMTGHPLDVSAHVQRVYVGGECVFQPPAEGALVIKAGTIWTKPGHAIRNGQILAEGGQVVAVGSSVPHPRFARVIDAGPGAFVTPGFIDAHGHLGLDGDRTALENSLRLSQLVGAADVTDLRVCRAGITTVLAAPYAASAMGSPLAAIKTAGSRRDQRVVGDPVAVLFDLRRADPGEIPKILEKPLAAGKKYLETWQKYEKELKEFLEKQEKGEVVAEREDVKEEETTTVSGPDPVTGIWEAAVEGAPTPEPITMTISVQLTGTVIEGRITRSSMGITGSLSGTFDGEELTATVDVNVPEAPSPINIVARLDGPDRMRGTISAGEFAFPIEAERVSKEPEEFRVERTRQRTRGKDGRPLPPKVDPALEPLKNLLEKKIPAVVNVTSAAQIQAVLEVLVEKNELPVTLLNAEEATTFAERLAEKEVAVVVPPQVLRQRQYRDYLQADDLARKGVTIAFQSNVEDGARQLPAVVLYAVQQGLDAEQALAALTLGAARALKIDDRVGSIEAGKGADFVIFSGHPFQEAGQVLHVVVDGKEVRP